MKNLLLNVVVASGLALPGVAAPLYEGYWESWNHTDSIEEIVSMPSDVLDVAFTSFVPAGNHTFEVIGVQCDPERLRTFIEAAHARGKRVKISVGGATFGLSGMLQTEADAQGMARAIVDYVEEFGFDGIDYDIEDYPSADTQVALIEHTRELLPAGKEISYTPKAPAHATPPYHEVIRRSKELLDGVNIMAYDFGPGYTYQMDVERLVEMGVAPEKIIIGLMPGPDDMGRMTSLVDLRKAAEYAVELGLGGIMIWDLNRDHENLTGLGPDAATSTVWSVFHP